MPHGTSLFTSFVVGIGLAFVFGAVAHRLRTSPLVGYLVAGIIVGPFTPGFVADQSLAPQMAEIGVILLMFGVGLHFSVGDLLAVRRVVVPGALAQVAASTGLGMALAWLAGWRPAAGLVFGLCLSVASTVVLMRALQERRLLATDRGHVAVGWLVMQDLLMVVALVLLPAVAGLLHDDAGSAPLDIRSLAETFGITLGKVVVFVALMLAVGRRVIPAVLHYIAHTGSRELFRLAVLSLALGVAFAALELFGVSFALGAFVAGMTLSESALSQVAAEETLPLRDAFAVLFFVSVGMLLNPSVLVEAPWLVLGTLALVLIGNPVIAFTMVRLLRQPAGTALLLGVGLGQIGEFSFILTDLGLGLGILPERGRDLVLAASILSIVVNPAMFAALGRWRQRDQERRSDEPPTEAQPLPLTRLVDHVVLVGYGRVGRLVVEGLLAVGEKLLIIENAPDATELLRGRPVEMLAGNAAEGGVLAAANLPHAKLLLVAIPDAFEAGQIVEQARAANPALEIVARAHFDAEVDHLLQHGANRVIMGEREIARSMLDHAAGHTPARPADQS
ncbi:MAG TPA: YbaL family putative K(+) efflux transporter [Stellaceae bacterium]|nr:YbaL family putative K(+) efflux transporter [Stellaceae bacterium]